MDKRIKAIRVIMREIKFRAYIPNLKRIVPVTRINFDVKTIEVDLTSGNGDYAEYDFDEVVIMQYTGLKDKNGVEIYEGDIVEYKDFSGGLSLFKEQPKSRGVIEVKDILSGIYLKGIGYIKGHKLEVLGNIYENPELLD